MAKLNWRIKMDKDYIWATMFRAVYLRNSDICRSKILTSTPSVVARNVNQGWELFNSGLGAMIGSLKSSSFWHGKWFNGNSVRSMILGPLTLKEDSLRINEVYSASSRNWDLKLTSFIFPDNIFLIIKAFPMSLMSPFDDTVSLKLTGNGCFSSWSAYNALTKTPTSASSMGWIWKLDILPKIKCFLWLCCLKRLPTKSLLHHRRIIHLFSETFCDSCFPLEDVRHVLWGCPRSFSFWKFLAFTPHHSSHQLLLIFGFLKIPPLDHQLEAFQAR